MAALSRVREVSVTYGPALGDAPTTRIATPFDVATVVRPIITDWMREHFVVILLDTRTRYRGTHLVSIGTLNASLVSPREVFRTAIITPGCASIIVAHNHPSGDTSPSREDYDVTKRLADAGKILGIPLIDSLVLTEDGGAHAMREHRPELFVGA